MIPESNIKLNNNMIVKIQPSKTYKVHFEDERVSGYIDSIDAIKQAVYKILSTERYEYPIYSWNYGIELTDLFGHSLPYVYSELKRRITEALVQDRRITDVDSFLFERKKSSISVTFTVHSTEGGLEIEKELSLNV